MFVSVWLKTTVPPGVIWPELFGVSERLRTALTVTASWMRSDAEVVGESARK